MKRDISITLISFAIGTILAFFTVWLLQSHIMHIIIRTQASDDFNISSTLDDYSYQANPVTAISQKFTTDDNSGGCGCPMCCGG
jgi:hypothetical protein